MSRYPQLGQGLAPPISRPRARREVSGLFSLFQPSQVQQFKEAFQLIDHDKDGWVTESDLREIFASLGITPTKKVLDDLLSARPGSGSAAKPATPRKPSTATATEEAVDTGAKTDSSDRGINFTMFLTMMSERLFEFDPEAELREAFECFDESDSGFVSVDDLRKWMGDVGERMDPAQIDKFLNGSFTDRQGNFNYREWIKVLRVNDEGDSEPKS